MGKIVAIVNQKGGVGKTTTAVNLAASLALLDFRVLLIDADPQGNASSGVGVYPDDNTISIYDCIVNGKMASEAVVETKTPNLFVMPATIHLVGAEIEMINFDRREYRMNDALTYVNNDYDFIFIDCAPSLGLVTLNALVASDSVIIPVQCEYFALECLGKLLNTIRIVQSNMNPNLSIEGILMTMYTNRYKSANAVYEDVRFHCRDIVFDTVITRTVRLSEAPSYGVPIAVYDIKSVGHVNYMNLAKEFLLKNGYTV